MKTLGIAGTAKNTGKTTTSLELIRQSTSAGLRTALTSIGFDGEEIDNVTGLPKPRYLMPRGSYLATAERCLRRGPGSADFRVVRETKIHTVLGPVVVVQITEPGTVLVAGPNRTSDLAKALDVFRDLGADLTIVDGALNRTVPLLQTDGLVLCTGAKLDTRIDYVAEHTRALGRLFSPVLAGDVPASGRRLTIAFPQGRPVELRTGSLVGEDAVQEIRRSLTRPVSHLVIPGACDAGLMRGLLAGQGGEFLANARLVFGGALKLVAGGDPVSWSRLFEDVQARGQVVEYLMHVPLLFVTVNPFYPSYLPRLRTFEPALVDAARLLAAVRGSLPGYSVLDIKQAPVPDLLRLLGLDSVGIARSRAKLLLPPATPRNAWGATAARGGAPSMRREKQHRVANHHNGDERPVPGRVSSRQSPISM